MALWDLYQNNQGRPIQKWSHYFPVYEQFFSDYINKPLVFWEIGVARGGSLQMWKKYFGPYARIIGIDITRECKAFEEDQVHVRIGSQTDTGFLDGILEEFGPPDIVLDDGSHMMSHVCTTFSHLYPRISSKGIYMVEDLHTAYWEEYEGGLGKETTFIEKCKPLIDELHADHARGAVPTTDFSRSTLSMHFFDSMAVFVKGKEGRRFVPRLIPRAAK